MNTQITPRKNWLQLNIDDSSEDQESPKNKELKYQKIYDISPDDQSFFARRDAFSSTKVQKGFFVNQQADQQYFDNDEVKDKNNSLTIETKSRQQEKKTIEKISQKEEKVIKEETSASSPVKLQSHEEKNNQSDKKQNKNEAFNKEEQKNNHRKSKMFHLNLSDSSESDLPDSQDQRQNQESDKQTKNQVIGKSQKQNDNQMNGLKLDDNKQQKQKMNQSQQSQNQQQNNMIKKKQQQNLAAQSKRLQDFNFDKQPQYQVLDQIPNDKRLRAYITRSNTGLNILWPQFQVKLQSNGLSLLLVKKQPFALSSVYNIYTKLISDKTRYFGKIQSNMAKDFYQIFISEDNNNNILRAQIDFQIFSKQNNQSRYFTVYLLKSQYNTLNLVGFQTFNKRSLKKCFQYHENRDKILKLETRKLIFIQQLRVFVLNFNGRINQASIKNFILENTETGQELIMFGRLDKQHFKIQISNPLNCVIGTAIAMVQFESRLMQ